MGLQLHRNALTENMSRMIGTYNEQVFKWERRVDQRSNVDDFVISDDTRISWSGDLKQALKRGKTGQFEATGFAIALSSIYTVESLF